MSKGFASSYRSGLLAIALLTCFAGIGARLVWLHVVNRDELLRYINQARQRLEEVPARRGDILDSRGTILATSRSLIQLRVDPWALRDKDRKKWPQLAALLEVPLPQLEKILTTKYRPPAPAKSAAGSAGPAPTAGLVFNLNLPPALTGSPAVPAVPAPDAPAAASPVKFALAAPAESLASAADDTDDDELDATPDQGGRRAIRYAKLAENISESTNLEIDKLGIKGLIPNRIYRRVYPHNELAAHVVGFVDHSPKQAPATGIERYADFYLRGQDGWHEGERDGRARELAQFRTRDVPRADGYSVTLSLDANVQDIVEQELAYIAEKYQPLKASIVVSDPRTGFILGLGNYPTYNPNEFNRIPVEAQATMNNVAVTDVYEPGSVFKIVAASGALEEGLVTPSSTFDCTLASVEYQGTRDVVPTTHRLPAEDKSDHFDRPLTVEEIIAHSSNKGAAQLAMKLGDDRFYRYVRAFGFGQRTGLPGGPEVVGLLSAPANWDGMTITRMPMGQGIAVTVMQMHQAMSVIASGGVLLRPQLVREVRDAAGAVVYRFDRSEVHRVISQRTAQTMAGFLSKVASNEGNAREAIIPGYDVAGKTGTAQKTEETINARGEKVRTYSTHHHVASFVGFFPASHPQIAISVIVDDADAHTPGGIAYGHSVAAPSFKRIGEKLISYPYLDIRPTGMDSATSPGLLALEGGRR